MVHFELPVHFEPSTLSVLLKTSENYCNRGNCSGGPEEQLYLIQELSTAVRMNKRCYDSLRNSATIIPMKTAAHAASAR